MRGKIQSFSPRAEMDEEGERENLSFISIMPSGLALSKIPKKKTG